MNKIVLTRRQIIKTLIGLGAGGAFLFYWGSLPGDRAQVKADTRAVSDGKPSLEVFAALSSLITLHDNLDPATTQRMYKVFMDEPWGPDHILRLYRKIITALPQYTDKKKHPPMKDKSWQFDDGEKWFANHLLMTWYTGIYYHEQMPTQVITYENALKFAAIKGLIPIPYHEATGFGAWANPPEENK